MATERSYWLRLYTDIYRNIKLRSLSEGEQLVYLWLLCLHKEGMLVGREPADLGWLLRLPAARMERSMERLRDARLLNPDNSPVGWEERQYVSDNVSDRVMKHRMKRREDVSCNVTSPLHATPPEAETETETETEKKQNREETDSGSSIPSSPSDSGNGLSEQFVLRLCAILNGHKPPKDEKQRKANITCAGRFYQQILRGEMGPASTFLPVMWARAADAARTAQNPWSAFTGYMKTAKASNDNA